MNLQTFKAPTMAEALTQVKSSMGTDAVILHTRTFQTRAWLGLRRKEMVEITAGRGIGIAERRRQSAPSARGPAAPPATYGRPGTVTRRAIESRPASTREFLETPAATGAAMLSISQEMSALKSMVKDLVVQTRQRQAPNVPEELFDLYLRLTSNQVSEDLATEVIKDLQRQVRPEHFAQGDYVKDRLIELLEKLVTTTGPIVRTKRDGPHVVALGQRP